MKPVLDTIIHERKNYYTYNKFISLTNFKNRASVYDSIRTGEVCVIKVGSQALFRLKNGYANNRGNFNEVFEKIKSEIKTKKVKKVILSRETKSQFLKKITGRRAYSKIFYYQSVPIEYSNEVKDGEYIIER